MAAKCPHNCSRCRAIEAGHGGEPFTPAQFMEIFDLVEQPSRNGMSPETVAAFEAQEFARLEFEESRGVVARVGGEIRERRNRREPVDELEVALAVAVEDCERAEEGRRRAAANYRRLRSLDGQAQMREEYEAGQRELARQREQQREASRGRGVLERLRPRRSK